MLRVIFLRNKNYRNDNGFTLIEVMIALLILTIISAMMATGLRSAIRSQDRITRKSADIANIQRGVIIIERDIEQIIDRPVIGVNGNRLPPVMIRYQGGKLFFEFTRAGFINPFAMQNRTTMQRVSYHLDGTNLLRTTWAELDRVATTPTDTQILLSNVNSFKVQFVNNKHQLYTPNETPTNLIVPLPLGIEIDVNVEGYGSISRLMAIL